MKNEHVPFFDTVENDKHIHRKTAQANAQIRISSAPNVRVAGKKIEAVGYGINELIGNFNAAAVFSGVLPDVIEIGFCLWSNSMSHQLADDC